MNDCLLCKQFALPNLPDCFQPVTHTTRYSAYSFPRSSVGTHNKSDRTYQVWPEGSQPEMIRSEETFPQKLEYIHNNPVRRGYVDDPVHWRYSSAGDYAGEGGLI